MRTRAQAGFTMLEALIALLIGGFGLLAITRLQIGLQGESDLAKQLTEATMLGQRRIEQLRSYQLLGTASGSQLAAGQWGYGNIATGSQTVTGTNAAYTVAWTVTDAPAPQRYKTAAVNVTWTDRRGTSHTVPLRTGIAGVDPSVSLGLTVPPAGTPIRRPKNRDLNVPVPAIDLGNGTSAFTPPGAVTTLKFIFDNVTGVITKRCSGSGSDWTSWSCTDVSAYLVSGFISIDNQANATLSSPIDIAFTLTQGTLDACYDDSASSTKTYAGVITYTCVIVGVDHDGVPTTRPRWSGRSTLTGITISTAAAGNKVCRYSADYDANGSVDSAEHPNTYANVIESLENQNFYIVKGNASCPTGSGIETLVQHQP